MSDVAKLSPIKVSCPSHASSCSNVMHADMHIKLNYNIFYSFFVKNNNLLLSPLLGLVLSCLALQSHVYVFSLHCVYAGVSLQSPETNCHMTTHIVYMWPYVFI